MAAGDTAKLGALMQDVLEPPVEQIGALPVDSLMKNKEPRALAPDRDELETLTVNVELRVKAWLRRRGFLEHDPGEHDPGEHDPGEHDPGEHDPGEHDPGEPVAEPAARSAFDSCLQGSLGLGELSTLRSKLGGANSAEQASPSRRPSRYLRVAAIPSGQAAGVVRNQIPWGTEPNVPKIAPAVGGPSPPYQTSLITKPTMPETTNNYRAGSNFEGAARSKYNFDLPLTLMRLAGYNVALQRR